MKRRKSGNATTDLSSFFKRTAAKKIQFEPKTSPSINESQLQIVVFRVAIGQTQLLLNQRELAAIAS